MKNNQSTTQKPKRQAKDNLVPLSTKKAREIGKIGGIRSGEVKKEKRQVKELLETMFESKAPEDLKEKFQVLFPNIRIEKLEDILNLAIIKKAVKGDVQAYNAVYDRKEGKPQQKTDITTDGQKIESITNINQISPEQLDEFLKDRLKNNTIK